MTTIKGSKPREDVGYKRPPPEHKFKKKQSGNPRGRPRKTLAPKAQPSVAVANALLAEAYKPITLSENGIPKKMPVAEAIVRRFTNAALGGDRVSARRYYAVTHAAEQRKIEATKYKIGVVSEYMRRWTEEIKRACDAKEPELKPIPHPDDIVIDTVTGEIRFNGPVTKEEQAEWDQAERDWHRIMREIERFEAEIADPERAVHVPLFEAHLRVERAKLAEIERCYPDEQGRRMPGFNLQERRAERTRPVQTVEEWLKMCGRSRRGPNKKPAAKK